LLPTPQPRALNLRDAGVYVSLSPSYLRVLIERRQLPAIRIGRSLRLLIDDLDSLLLSRRVDRRRVRLPSGVEAEVASRG
jgi:excisionase family DNA binding protein